MFRNSTCEENARNEISIKALGIAKDDIAGKGIFQLRYCTRS